MASATEAQIEAAEARGRELLERAPRAKAAYYDREKDRVVLDLAVKRRAKGTPYGRRKGTPFSRSSSGEARSPQLAQRVAAG